MAEYDLSRLTILLVEDNSYIRNVLANIFRGLGVENISTAVDGETAINHLKAMSADGRPGPDIIISDLVMSPVNGLLLVRWVRSAKESPNRMVPFIMMSGGADGEYVNSARELGMTEFLAKPFSVTSIYERLLEVIDYPRQFVTTQNYFGPDRRRHKEPLKSEDMRSMRDDDVTLVYSADKVVKPTKPSDVWYWRLPNSLQGKVAGGDAGPNTKGSIPVDLLEQAEEELERAALDFTKWAGEYLQKLSHLCSVALLESNDRSPHFAKIHTLALELRGQGGTFGYPLISTIGKMLFDCTGEDCAEDDTAVEIIKCHIDSMRAIIREEVAGDGGQIGQMLLKGLQKSIAKHHANHLSSAKAPSAARA